MNQQITEQQTFEQRQKFVLAFNDTMLKIWREQMTLLGVIDTGRLLHFLSDNIAHEFVGVVAQALDDKYVRYNH